VTRFPGILSACAPIGWSRRKLVRALPEPFREPATAAAEAVVLDPAGWGAASPPAVPHLELLQRAVAERAQVRLRYARSSGAVTARTVGPLGVAAKGGAWYLLADTAAGRRTFRVDRIRAVTPTGRAATRPPGFDLAEAWRETVAHVDAWSGRSSSAASWPRSGRSSSRRTEEPELAPHTKRYGRSDVSNWRSGVIEFWV
jgi:predicted DNA-binding transcriptional regulator YafY